MLIADLVAQALGPDVPVAVRSYDGGYSSPPSPVATLDVQRPEALRRLLTFPTELGFARAYVAGDLEVEGDLAAALAAIGNHPPHLQPQLFVDVAKLLGPGGLRPLPPPPEEARLHGLRHTRERDSSAISHHYDVSNDFYRILLGPTMTYSCGVWATPDAGLDAAQAAKYELVAQKLALRPGMRLLDVGCGWGGMALHAAAEHGVRAIGITISERQAELAKKRVADAGLSDQVEIRLQDYRDVDDGPYDAISSIGMFEHVGLAHLREYFERLHSLLPPEGRLLNHAIGRPANATDRLPVAVPTMPWGRRTFVQRFVFPDGELHEVGSVVSAMQRTKFEVRHLESLREHYALTLRAWSSNLDARWDDAVSHIGERRARVWRLSMAAFAVGFDAGRIQVHQVLAVKSEQGRSGFPLRPAY
jgi:cyclopropane-fatty-acyl-phospholipid synthase